MKLKIETSVLFDTIIYFATSKYKILEAIVYLYVIFSCTNFLFKVIFLKWVQILQQMKIGKSRNCEQEYRHNFISEVNIGKHKIWKCTLPQIKLR